MSIRCTLPEGQACDVRPGETLLDACRRSAITIPFSCTAGICHTCMLRAEDGPVPAEAQSGLDPRLQQRNYLLACRCEPTAPLVLQWPDARDRIVEAVLYEVERSGPYLHVRLETARELRTVPGTRLGLSVRQDGEPIALQISRADADGYMIEGLVSCDAAEAGALETLAFGSSLWVHGPLAAIEASTEEMPAPQPDPGLWAELEDGATVRRVLEDFYERVYADPRLAPFFTGITIDRSIDKQYSFLRQLMTGERVYFGDRPRNAHHWMVISEELFDYRQAVMEQTLAEHGLSPAQVSRWTRIELHWRSDIVKAHAWPRIVHGQAVPADGYARETLAEATVCDHCGDAVDAGVSVAYHLRLGTISCPDCQGEPAGAIA
jgi:truncated hemoglobin YjbI/ferredoxin